MPLPQAASELVAAPAAAFLRAEAAYAEQCVASVRNGVEAPRSEAEDHYHAFEAAFISLRQAGHIRSLDFADAGRVFGLAFAIEVFHRDFVELGDRLGSKDGGSMVASSSP